MHVAKPWWMMLLTLALWLMATLDSPDVGWGQPKYGGTLVMVHTDPDLMNPVATPGWIQFQRMSFNGLIDYDVQGNIVPSVATSWEISEDGLTYTFQLRQALTAEDVKFTYEKILDPQIASRFNLPFQSVQDVQAPSPSNVVVTLKRPDPVFLAQL
jgi:peptide/nickel transport system substrate-binding protein